MDINVETMLTVAVCIFAVVTAIFGMKVAKKKDYDLKGAVKKAAEVYGVADAIATAIEPFIPAPYNALIHIIFAAAEKGVKLAEEAWKAGTCAEDERKAKASELINSALEAQNITIDKKVENLVDTATEVMVKTLPKSHAES